MSLPSLRRIWHRAVVIGIVCCAVLLPRPTDARVVRFVVEHRRPLADGVSWGTVGPYERLDGTAYFEIDPRDPLNAVVVNLDKAPRNARGLVEFSSPFYILKPVDLARGNRKLFYGINNRGGQVELAALLQPGMPWVSNVDPVSVKEIADGLLFRMGFSYVDAGWHGDGLAAPGRLFPRFPVATLPGGSPIVQQVRVEMQTSRQTFTQRFINGFSVEAVADLDKSHSTLTVRTQPGDPRVAIPSDQWAFGSCPKGKESLTASTTEICLFPGFEPSKLYELIYPARDPMVMGLAYVVTRDVASFLRNSVKDDAGNPNPLTASATEVGIRRAYASGTSSTGMYLRDWLYLGFNEDEAHRKVFDAVTIHRAGTYRLFANTAFAHPTFIAGQDAHHDYLSNAIAPFTFPVTTDPVTGVRDGILKRPATDPLVMQIDGEIEVWSWKGSLNVVDSAGARIPMPPNVRLYYNPGTGHGDITGLLTLPAQRNPRCANLEQQAGGVAGPARALLVAIDAWADRGVEPPKSNYPGIEPGTLISFDEYRRVFPKIPGAVLPRNVNELHVMNFGPLFTATGGVQTVLPPIEGAPYNVLVPKPDADGVTIAGGRTIHTRAPLGTNVGWNVQIGAHAGYLCGPSGSFFPFATTKAERLAAGDPRPSLEERYKDHDGFVRAVERAAKELVQERLLLEEDAARYIKAAQASDALRPAGRH